MPADDEFVAAVAAEISVGPVEHHDRSVEGSERVG